MGPLVLLGLLAGGLMLTAFDGSDTPEPEEDDTPVEVETDPDPDPDPEVGAVVDYDEGTNTLSIDKGADETGDVVMMTSRGQNDGDLQGFTLLPDDTYDLTAYLVPEGVDLIAALNGAHDLDTAGDGPTAGEIAASVGATQLGQWSFDIDYNGADTLPDLDIADGTDPVFGQMTGAFGGGFFVPEAASEVASEAALLDGFTDTEGENGVYHDMRTDGEAVDGTDKNDEFRITAENTTVRAGDGDDTYVINNGSDGGHAVYGEGGDDWIEANASVDLVDGGTGSDDITLNRFAGAATGGDGDDAFAIFDLKGGTVDGGAGDDMFYLQYANTGSLTGGAGADAYVFGPDSADALQPTSITDFDPTEDQLAIAVAGEDGPFEISILRDLVNNRTEVRVTVPGVEAETGSEYGVLIYLEGAPDISEADIALVENVPELVPNW